MSDNWTKIIPLVPSGDPSFLTCGGVTKLNTADWERERELDRWQGPKLGEAGADEMDPFVPQRI